LKICVVIPARLASSRLPNKVILPLFGKPMVQWVYEAAQKVNGVDKILIATDSAEVYNHVVGFGGDAVMTSEKHTTGTDRIGEVARQFEEYDVFINIQGDEPLISPTTIQQMVDFYRNGGHGIVTLYDAIRDESQLFDFNVVKLTVSLSGKILYFSRAAIPAQRDFPFKQWMHNRPYYRHIGMYGFERKILLQICALPQSGLEKSEMLEQLRWLENDFEIYGLEANHQGIGVDTMEDLLKAEDLLRSQNP